MQWKRLECLLVTLLCLTLVACADGGKPQAPGADEREMANAFRSVLLHGDLTDLADVSRRLGLRLHSMRYSTGPGTDAGRTYATSATVPHFLLANVSYQADPVRERNLTSVYLRFTARVCPSLKKWAREWGLSYQIVALTDAAGSVEVVSGPGAKPISLTLDGRGLCFGYFSQLHPGITEYAPAADEAHDAGSDLVHKIAAVALVGDLRDYRKTGRALGAEWISHEMPRNGLLYDDSAVLAQPVAGIDASLSSYDVQDSGWLRIPGFTWQPRELGERKATMTLNIDTTQVCIPATALAAELRRRALPYRAVEVGELPVLRSEQKGNRLDIAYQPFGRCVGTFYLTQLTDFQHSVGPRVTFAPGDALASGSDSLSSYAVDRITEVVRRLREVSPREVDIAECVRPETPDTDRVTALHLADLVRSALLARGVRPEQIHVGSGSDGTAAPATTPCSDWRNADLSLQGVPSYVTLRALAE